MLRSQKLAEEIAAKNAIVQGVVAKGAEATDEEITSAESALTEIADLETKRTSALAMEAQAAKAAEVAAKIEKTSPNPVAFGNEPVKVETKSESGLVFPRVRGKLKSFFGDEAHKDAMLFGAWFLATIDQRNQRAKRFCEDNGIQIKTYSEGVNSAGGFLVPAQFENMLIDLRELYGVFRRNTEIRNMTSDTHSDPRRTGGVTAYWGTESDSITASTGSWDRVNLTAKKLMALCRVTSELNEDSAISVADNVASEIAYAFAKAEDDAGFVGDGTSAYGHIVGATNAILNLSATRANIAGAVVAAGNAFSEVTLANLNSVKALLPQYARAKGAKWYCNSAFYYGVMEKLAVAAGGVTEQGVANGVGGPRFLGDPVEITQSMIGVEANDTIAALYGNLALASRLGDRRSTTIALSEHSRFANDEIEIRGTERVDIVVHDVGNASSSASARVPGPIVGLLLAAS